MVSSSRDRISQRRWTDPKIHPARRCRLRFSFHIHNVKDQNHLSAARSFSARRRRRRLSTRPSFSCQPKVPKKFPTFTSCFRRASPASARATSLLRSHFEVNQSFSDPIYFCLILPRTSRTNQGGALYWRETPGSTAFFKNQQKLDLSDRNSIRAALRLPSRSSKRVG